METEFLGQPSGKLQAFFDLSGRHRYVTFFMEVLYKFFKSFNVVLFLLFLYGIYKRRFISYSQSDTMFSSGFLVVFGILFVFIKNVLFEHTPWIAYGITCSGMGGYRFF